MMHEEKHVLPDEEDHSDSSYDDLNENMEELTNDEQGKLVMYNNTRLIEDLMDNGLETFV